MRRVSTVAFVAVALGLVAALAAEGIHKIQHVVMIMQENRSFDQYFGTYPGANEIPGGCASRTRCMGGAWHRFMVPAIATMVARTV
jgi:phospholipase C